MHDLPTDPVQHEVGRMSVSESQNVTDHGHDGQGASVIGASLEPNLGLSSPRFVGFGIDL